MDKLFYSVGGFPTIRKVHKFFYDRVYAHPWLKEFFKGHDQGFIEEQQTYFMAEKMGGPRLYCGKPPDYAHQHMYITDELFELRQRLLTDALKEAQVCQENIKRWLRIDNAFKKQIVKSSLETFHAQYTFKERIVIDKPNALLD